ncbi:DUF1501 domain-containing protein [Ideonella paludis]|uniref:DUF1501 domain-containing protein n=1 Tax=Ideonella paludis TaxID=1233411 RepID=A0ABS5DYX7_9BURK|nr:DUF1501 domain-containing protein [Ideonella paludis]MBQ0936356.1 DUF1501 domain-containing protein [Ideonella paludis]
MQRRDLLKAAALGSALWFPVGRHAMALARPAAQAAQPRLVVILLRGAMDGLSVVAPYADPDYARARPDLAMAKPGSADGLLDLDGRFGLHPALAPLMPLWQKGQLGFVQASGSHDPTRSHFDAQDYMETGTPGRKSTQDGWLNRLMQAWPASAELGASASRAVSVGAVLPRICQGSYNIANLPSVAAVARLGVLDKPRVASAFEKLYAGDDAMGRAYREARQARQEVRASMEDDHGPEMNDVDRGAPLPNGLPDDAARLSQVMRNDPRVQMAFLALGGWDTHSGQGTVKGRLANGLAPLARGLAELAQGLGPVWQDTVVMVMSEFGRTVRQNGTGGTDHGHGNVMMLAGGRVHGGKVHGEWPGLESRALYEGRDLAITTDFRDVIANVMARHLRLPDSAMASVLPGYSGPARRLDLFRA